MKPGTEWERPADKTAKHYGNRVAEFLRCMHALPSSHTYTHKHTHTHTHTHQTTHTNQNANTLSLPGHMCLIMRWCIWLAGGGNNGPDPRHLCGDPHHGRVCRLYQRADHNASGVLEPLWLAVPSQKQDQVHEQTPSDWLSRAQKAAGGKGLFLLAAAASFCWWMGVWVDGTGTTGSTETVRDNIVSIWEYLLYICSPSHKANLCVTNLTRGARWNNVKTKKYQPHSNNRSFALISY